MLTEADLEIYFNEHDGVIDQAELLDYILENSDGKISRENAITAIETNNLYVAFYCKDLSKEEKITAGNRNLVSLLRKYAKEYKDEEDEQGDKEQFAKKYNDAIRQTNETMKNILKDTPSITADIHKLKNITQGANRMTNEENLQEQRTIKVKKDTLGDGIKYAIDNDLLIPQAWVEKYNEIIKKNK